jgi:hypothetical protein
MGSRNGRRHKNSKPAGAREYKHGERDEKDD